MQLRSRDSSAGKECKICLPHQLPSCMQYVRLSYKVPRAAPTKPVLFIIAEMLSSTLRERFRWLVCLGSSAPCRLQSLLTVTAQSYTILSLFARPPDRTLTFPPFCQMFGPAEPAVVPALVPGEVWWELLPNQSHSEIPHRPWIALRKVFARGLSLHEPLPTKRPRQLTELKGNLIHLLEYWISLWGARILIISILCYIPLTILYIYVTTFTVTCIIHSFIHNEGKALIFSGAKVTESAPRLCKSTI